MVDGCGLEREQRLGSVADVVNVGLEANECVRDSIRQLEEHWGVREMEAGRHAGTKFRRKRELLWTVSVVPLEEAKDEIAENKVEIVRKSCDPPFWGQLGPLECCYTVCVDAVVEAKVRPRGDLSRLPAAKDELPLIRKGSEHGRLPGSTPSQQHAGSSRREFRKVGWFGKQLEHALSKPLGLVAAKQLAQLFSRGHYFFSRHVRFSR
jgi:hypothetical protein